MYNNEHRQHYFLDPNYQIRAEDDDFYTCIWCGEIEEATDTNEDDEGGTVYPNETYLCGKCYKDIYGPITLD